MPDLVELRIAEGVASLTLNRPEALNAFSVAMMQSFRQTVEKALADPGVAVIVLAGAGGNFSAGGDVAEFQQHVKLAPGARLPVFRGMVEQWVNPAVRKLREAHQPVIASVRGACAGLGLSLVAGCDLAVSGDDAVYAAAFAGLGLPPDGGLTWFLPRIVGAKQAAALLYLGERLDAGQALSLGLVNRVVPAADLDSEVTALAARLASGPRQVIAENKRLLAGSSLASLDTQLQDEAESFGRCSATGDFAEGVAAFLDKRPAKFRGK